MIDSFLKLKKDKMRSAVADLAKIDVVPCTCMSRRQPLHVTAIEGHERARRCIRAVLTSHDRR
jgi:hypothetical protein